jgi:hypothetical protein
MLEAVDFLNSKLRMAQLNPESAFTHCKPVITDRVTLVRNAQTHGVCNDFAHCDWSTDTS